MGRSQDTISPQVPEDAKPILGQAQSFIPQFNNLTLDPRIYTPTPLQNSAQSAGQSLLGPNSPFSAGTSSLANILSPNFLSPNTNPFLSSTLGLANRNFSTGLGGALDQLSSSFGAAGQNPGQSGTFMNAAQMLARNSLNDYGLNIGNILANNYSTGVGQQLQGMQSLGSLASILGPLNNLGAVPQQLAETQQQGQIGLNQIPFNMLMQILQNMPLAFPQTQNNPSILSGILGGGATGAIAGGKFGPLGAILGGLGGAGLGGGANA